MDASGLLPTPDTHHTDLESPTPEEETSIRPESKSEAIEMSVRRDGYHNRSFSVESAESPTNNNSHEANGINHVKTEVNACCDH